MKDRKFKKEEKTSKNAQATKTKVAVAPQVEEKFIASNLAERMGISDLDFSIIRRQHKIDKDSLITATELRELYNKTFKG